MRSNAIRKVTVMISLAGIAMIFALAILGGSFDKQDWGETYLEVWAGVLVSVPSLLLAAMAGRKANGPKLSTILFCSAVVSTTLWTLVTAYFALAPTVDAQSGLLAGFVFVIHLAILFVAVISFIVLRKR